MTRRTANRRTGGRSARVVRDVLESTLAELARVGFEGLRVEDVAARAGVNKTTVYRRWGTKTDLVAAAVRRMASEVSLQDTGSLRTDLVALLTSIVDVARRPETRAVARIVDEVRDNPALERMVRVLRRNALEVRSAVIERAKARGELAADVDGRLVLDMVTMPISFRVGRYQEHVDAETIERLVDMALLGVLRKPAATG